MSDSKYMKLAIKLAQKGAGYVNPNPMVGAVIVKDNHIIGQGYHEFFGGSHAERNALKNCRESPVGATLYVTLEPCCHFGKTPPCIDAIIDSGITRVVIGSLDCNPIVSGKGVKILEENNLQVTVGFASSDIGSNLIDMAPRNLDKLFDIDIWVKFQSLISDKEFPNFPSDREVGSACRTEEYCFVK